MAEDLDETITRLVSLRFAAQRFNTIADLSAKIILNIAPIFEFLLHLSIEGGHDAQWAKNLMDEVYTPGNLLLALVAEMSDIANRFSRRFDGVEGQGDRNSRLIKSAAWVASLRSELDRMFSFRTPEGQFREPLVIKDNWETGYVQILCRQWNMLESTATGLT